MRKLLCVCDFVRQKYFFKDAFLVGLLFLLFTIPNHISGTGYYVSPSGKDINTGSINSPFLTISKGVTKLKAGDTLFIRNGIYVERVVIEQSGTVNSPIIIMAYPGESPVIDGQGVLPNSDNTTMFYVIGNYIYVSGIEIKNIGTNGLHTGTSGILLRGRYTKASHIVVHNAWSGGIYAMGDYSIVEYCTVYDAALENYSNPGAQYNASGISACRDFADGVTEYAILRNNTVHDVWGEGLSTFETKHCLVENNIVYDNWSVNLYISDSQHTLVQGNLVYRTKDLNLGSQVGILLGDETYSPASSNNVVINNIVYGCKRNFYSGKLDTVLVSNNTFMNSGYIACVQINNAAHTSSSFINNIIIQEDGLPTVVGLGVNANLARNHNSWSKTPVGDASGTGDIIGNPQIAKAGSIKAGELSINYFKLLKNSPLINKAKKVNTVTHDYLNNARDSLPDIGAHEYMQSVDSTAKKPPVISNIPNQTITEGNSFATITLDNYVSDPDNSDDQINWTFSGNSQLSVSINSTSRTASIFPTNAEWNGNETITFRATDPDGLYATNQVVLTVSAVNDPPVVTDIPNQTINEGSLFNNIDLDNYVNDLDNSNADITWSFSGNSKLNIVINSSTHVAVITPDESDWHGSETIIFKATDPSGLSSSDQVTFTLAGYNNPPVINNQEIQINEEDYQAGNIGKIAATAVDSEQKLTFQIVAGNESGLFSVDNQTGDMSTEDQNLFTYSARIYNLTITVEDNGAIPKSSTAIVTIKLFSKQTTIYIDPEINQGELQDGTFDHPFSSWNKVIWKSGNSYLQKKGTTSIESKISINASNVSLGAYGEGKQPVIQSNSDDFAIQAFEKNNITIDNIHIIAEGSVSCIYILGNSDICKIERCTLEGADNGVRIVDANTVILAYNTFTNCTEAIYSVADNNKFHYNVFTENQTAININSYLSTAEIYNNVFFDNFVALAASYSNLSLYNNIFYLENNGDIALSVKGDTLNSDNNIFYPEQEGFLSISDIKFNTLSEYQQLLKHDMYSSGSDPKFIDVYSKNFEVDLYSPAINRGRTVNLFEDLYGKTVPYGIATDIGVSESRVNALNPLTSNNINTPENEGSFVVYPNPSDGKININLKGIKQGNSKLSIIDLAGKKIFEENYYPNNNEFLEHLDLSNMLYGIYFIILKMEDKVYNQRIVIN